MNGVFLQMQDLDIAITVQNRQLIRTIWGLYPLPPFISSKGKPTYTSPLWIELRFNTPSPSNNNASDNTKTDIEFRPMDIHIESAGVKMSPKGFVGPGGGQTFMPNLSPSFRQRYPCIPKEKDPRIDEEDLRVAAESIFLRGKNCFWFAFDRSPSPDEPFVFHLNGLTRGGVSRQIPPIRFEKGGAWSTGTIP
ncbi:MAG: hypothetical protein WAO55_02310 [Candidatus Manganitrophaceae bacterium]